MVFPCGVVPESRSGIAPSNSMSSLLAVRIFVVTGVRSETVNPSWESRLSPARQLWHPVSASAETVALGALS